MAGESRVNLGDVDRSFETRTLLFSDIEGSTRLLAALGDDYPGVLADHHALVRTAVVAHHGVEHSTGGDGFFMIFPSARDAMAAAVDAQLALGAHAWPEGAEVRVRMGVHAGEIGWADGDVVGMAIHEAARIADAAHGGQVLVSPIVRELVGQSMPAGVTLRSLGRHRLKDLTEAIELFQVCHPDLRGEFPGARVGDVVIDLPVPRTSFVGRDAETTEVLRLLADSRHVTLTGVGGSGKTRLALEVATREADRHRDGVFFVDLAPVADPGMVLSAIAAGVSVQGDPSDLQAMVLAYLSHRRALIVLDNCEHLIDACADLVDTILAACPAITILATSREALQIDGEQSYRVPSLSVDTDDSEAALLFVSRARSVAPDFELTGANHADILTICRRLDGIPLAIELAAARVGHFSVADITRRLDERFDLLVGGRRRRAQRQQTLQAAMDWSWDLLNEAERTVLRRLAVFSGSFALDAAEAVCAVDSAVEVLSSLVTKSLVNLESGGETTRYRLLETVRLFAQDRLVESGEAAERRDAHRDWFLAQAEAIGSDAFLDLRVLALCIVDYGNHRAALDWSAARGRTDLVARLVPFPALAWVHVPALHDEARRWLSHVADNESQPAPTRGGAFAALALLAMTAGELSSIRSLAERALAFGADGAAHALALFTLGRYEEAEAVATDAGLVAIARWHRTWFVSTRIARDPRGALEAFEEVLGEMDPTWRGWDRWWALIGSALARLLLDDGSGALLDARTGRQLLEGSDSWGGSLFRYSAVLETMALAHLGRFDEARMILREMAAATLRDRYPLVGTDCVVALAYVTAREGDPVAAVKLLAPVIADGRLRVQPMYFFLGSFLRDLDEAVAADTTLSPRAPLAFTTRATAIMAGGAARDLAAEAQIESILIDFIAPDS